MKKKSSSKSAFFNFRVLLFLCAAGALLVLAAFGARPGGSARPQPSAQDRNGGLAQAQEADNNNVSPSGPGLVPGQRASSSSFTLMEVTADNGATVTTDKADYAPGETVVISGTGWTANQEVALHIDDSNGVARWDASVIADGAGNISNSGFVVGPGDVAVVFTLTATQGAVTAWTQFTDLVGAGVAPNGDPGGFEIEGDLRAGTMTPPGGTDWLDTTSASGVGGLLFETGVPKDPAVTGPATGAHIDKANCGNACDDVFDGGKAEENPSITWHWQTGASNNKTDMNNAYFHISTSANGDRWVTASGDRFSTNGTAFIDFELLQATLTKNVLTGCVKPPCGNFTSAAPASTGGRTENDIEITAEYGNGGGVASLKVSQWKQVGGVWQYVDVSGSIPASSAFVGTSLIPLPTGVPVPYGAFNVTPGTYSPNQFVEFSIDLTALLNVIGDPCEGINIKTLMVKTKTSTAPLATIEDLISPFQISFSVGFVITGSKTDPLCPSDTGTVTATWTGGVGPFECKLDDGGTYAPCDSPKSYNVASGSTHTIFVKDTGNNNCVKDTGELTVGAGCTTAPTIGGQGSNGTVECPANPTFTAPTASDNCAGGALTPTDLGDTTSGNSCSLTHTKSWRATDACGNTSGTVSQAITVHDTTAPSISTLPAASTIECPASPSFATPTATDACDASPTLTFADVTTPGSCPQDFSVTRTWTATDHCSNSSTASQSITVHDTTAPSISTLPAASTIECPASPSFATPTATDACDASPTLTFADVTTPGSCPQDFSVTRTWTATDHCGNSSTASQSITVHDTTAPSISTLPAASTIECPASPSFATPTATDACDASPTLTFADVTTPGSCPQDFSVTRTWTATDHCGNSSTASQSITVHDTTAPSISTLPAASTIECPASPSFATPTATDACDASPTLTFADVTTPGSCPQDFSVTRTWTATDDCGNSSTASQSITVHDTTAPSISTLPAASTIECPASPSFATPTATDACDASPTLTFADVTTPGSCPQDFSVTRTWTATDDCGNSSTASQSITVHDTTAPSISTLPAASTIECPASPSFATPTATDACDASPTLTFADVTTPGSCPQDFSVTRTWTATDHCGNSSTASQSITVHDTTAPSISTLPAASTIECPASPSFATPTASDACDASPTLTFADVTTPGSCPQDFSVTRTWTATDHCGNSSTASQSITVHDTTAPSISTLPAASTIECPASPSFATPTATDACDASPTLTFADVTTPGSCPQDFSVTRTWTATDHCGNSSTASQSITVHDTTAPSISTLPAASTIECPASPSFATPTATDACDASPTLTFADVTTPGSCPQDFSVTRTWTATDDCGNSSTASQSITVHDTTAPSISTLPAASTIECPASPSFATPTATDACDASPTLTFADVTTPGSCPQDFSVTRTWTATDHCGNSSTASQTINVADTTVPTIGRAGADITIACDGTPLFTPPTASDACSTATVQLVSDTTTTQGDNTIYTKCWNAVDACNNTSATVCQKITRPACAVSQITPTGTTCTQFRDGTAPTLSTLNYKVKNGVIQQVSPGVFFYWVAVTATVPNQCFTITQTNDHNNTPLFDLASGSNVFTSGCNSVHPNITQDATGAVTACWNATVGSTYIIGIKYSASSITGDPAPSPPTTVQYTFTTTGVPGSNQGLNLVRSN